MTDAALEMQAAQSLYAARRLQDALHNPGPWTIRWGTVEVEATRTVSQAGVVFECTFPEVCWIDRPDPFLILLCNGEVTGMRRIDDPGDCCFAVTWALAADPVKV